MNDDNTAKNKARYRNQAAPPEGPDLKESAGNHDGVSARRLEHPGGQL